jgi:hypothetical protein
MGALREIAGEVRKKSNIPEKGEVEVMKKALSRELTGFERVAKSQIDAMAKFERADLMDKMSIKRRQTASNVASQKTNADIMSTSVAEERSVGDN